MMILEATLVPINIVHIILVLHLLLDFGQNSPKVRRQVGRHVVQGLPEAEELEGVEPADSGLEQLQEVFLATCLAVESKWQNNYLKFIFHQCSTYFTAATTHQILFGLVELVTILTQTKIGVVPLVGPAHPAALAEVKVRERELPLDLEAQNDVKHF